MRKKLSFLLLLLCCGVANAQETRLPLKMEKGHLYSRWILGGNNTPANVFLESGFPRIVFNETFAREQAGPLGLMLTEAPEGTAIALWGGQRYTVKYLIRDSITVNGIQIPIDALVADFSGNPSWEERDIVFPIADLPGRVELNIREQYMALLPAEAEIPPDFTGFRASPDQRTKGLYLTTVLECRDQEGLTEKLAGNFLLDLGAGNAVILNKNRPEVRDFVCRTERMHLTDTTRFRPNPRTELSMIMPEEIRIGDIPIDGVFIAAMKLYVSESTEKYVGILGNPFFENFTVIFDYPEQKFYLRRNSDRVKDPR